MIVKVVLLPGKNERKIELQEDSTALNMLKMLNLNPDVMLVIRNDVPMPVDEKLKDKDVLKVVRVVSGG
ncbi:MAG: MoaD/ThiS family protein [Thermoplasmatales archaeon]|nr:MoaD/ThiS family protein [Thermoplasmatales archaeon]